MNSWNLPAPAGTSRREFLNTSAAAVAGALLGGAVSRPGHAGENKSGPGQRGAGLSQREIVKRAMGQRPDDPWPRGWGHVVLASPGSQQPAKGYHEPGGSFSPAAGSFGVSIWVRGSAGNLKTTGESIPLEDVRQRFSWPDAKGTPAIVTTTPHYQARWSCGPLGDATLELEHRGDSTDRLELAIRSVGPAGRPIRKIAWKEKRLTINDRWTLTTQPRPVAVWVGHEGDAGWKAEQSSIPQWEGTDGWGYARIELAAHRTARLRIHDEAPGQRSPLHFPVVRSTIELDLPDQRFTDCLHAQVAHLMMGLLDKRTPPGDPTNYPLAWQRDGAAVVAGLARAGQLEVARELAGFFAENDFFGGFGAEGDAPGQGLRVMEEVAVRLAEPAFDRWLWPHAQRKAELILKMASTAAPLRRPYVGPIVPEHGGRDDLDLVCEPARDGLIIGRMDFGRPVSYINAISYLGLRCAASLAERLRRHDQAQLWRAAAAGLRRAWGKAPQWEEDRTYISGLWPTWVAAAGRESYRARLEPRSDPQRYLPWTYFSAAVTHQWLLLGQPERVWENLEWFWKQQTSPGLYTWWEGSREENTFHLWEDIRGWVRPPHVTPHYWTAGEVLALQVEMLAYVDDSASQPVLVIGGGVPGSWIGKPMRVRGLPTSLGIADWSWQDGKMRVRVRGSIPGVRVGPAFGPAVRAEVNH
jgi:hypothetical protein